jgi:drug/metabolite transporter (DMT)-like permease
VTPWLAFCGLVAIWGSGFLFTRIGLDDLPPVTFVLYRLILGALAILAIGVVRREPLRAVLAPDRSLAVIGLLNVAGTFSLITWAQQYVPSGVASILVGATPLFATVMAATLGMERLTAWRAGGLAIGFAGLVVLFSGAEAGGEMPRQLPAGAPVLGALLILASALVVAGCAVYVQRRLAHLSPAQITMPQLVVSIPLTAAVALVAERPPEGLLDGDFGMGAFLATVWMGVLGAGLANLIFYGLIQTWGVTRTTLIAYVMPVAGVLLGVLVLHEEFDLRIAVATTLVVAGMVLVNAAARRTRVAEARVAGGTGDRVRTG